MTDAINYSFELKISLQLTCYSFLDSLRANPIKQWVPPPGKQRDPPRPSIEFINNFGFVRIRFDKQMWLPTSREFTEFLDHRLMRQNCTDLKANPDFCIERRQLQGQAQNISDSERVKEAIEIVNRGLVFINESLYPVVELEMKPGNFSDWRDLNFTWSCVDFQPTYMDIMVNFTNYPNVSIHDYADFL